MSLFGIRVFADVVKVRILRIDHPGLGWALNPMASVFVSDRKEEVQREEGCMKTEAVIGVT